MRTIRFAVAGSLAELAMEPARGILGELDYGDTAVVRVPKPIIRELDAHGVLDYLRVQFPTHNWCVGIDVAHHCVIVHSFPRPSYEDPMDDWD